MLLRFVAIHLVSISPTSNEQLFRTKDFRAAFLYLHCRFKLFRRKEIGAKAARKMLVKLTPNHESCKPHYSVQGYRKRERERFLIFVKIVSKKKWSNLLEWKQLIRRLLEFSCKYSRLAIIKTWMPCHFNCHCCILSTKINY